MTWTKSFHDDGKYNVAYGNMDEKQLSPTTSLTRKKENKDSSHLRCIIHIDVDCFYAQVEMIRNPYLKDKPIGIQQKYIIVTCNYEARKYGVTKLMLISEAKKKCPNLILVNGEDLTHYRDMSYKITNHLVKYSKDVERLGFDENFVDVSDMIDFPAWKTMDDKPAGHVYEGHSNDVKTRCFCGCEKRLRIASHIAEAMRNSLCQELGITSCAGVAYNKILAKMIGSMHKPNQQTVIFHENVLSFMQNINHVRNIPGIGRRCSERLESLGVHSVVDLQEIGRRKLLSEFGEEMTTTLKENAIGVDTSPVVITGQPKSLSDEDSFKKCDSYADARAKIEELLKSLLNRLLEDGRLAHTLRVTVRKFVPGEQRYYSNSRTSRQCPIPTRILSGLSTASLEEVASQLMPIALRLFEKIVDVNRPFHLTLINLCFSNLSAGSCDDGTPSRSSIRSFFRPQGKKKPPEQNTTDNSETGCLMDTTVDETYFKEDSVESICHSGNTVNLATVEETSQVGIKRETPASIKQRTLFLKEGLTKNIDGIRKDNIYVNSGIRPNENVGDHNPNNEECVSGFDRNTNQNTATDKLVCSHKFQNLTGAIDCKYPEPCEVTFKRTKLANQNERLTDFGLSDSKGIGSQTNSVSLEETGVAPNTVSCTNEETLRKLATLLPIGIQADVFIELPVDIQQDLMTQNASGLTKKQCTEILEVSGHCRPHNNQGPIHTLKMYKRRTAA